MTRTVTYAEFVPALRELQEQGRPIFAVACADGGYKISYGESKVCLQCGAPFTPKTPFQNSCERCHTETLDFQIP